MTDTFSTRARKRVGARFFKAFFDGLTALARLHPRARPEAHGVRKVANVAYGPRSRGPHLLDIYLPPESLVDADGRTKGPRPVVIYVHGGAFRILSKDRHFVMALAYARRGYVVFNINYRLAPAHPFPAAIEDVCLAYEWVVLHAAQYGGDISQLVLAGESAGANLVVSATLAACYKRPEGFARALFDTGVVPKAVVPAYGIFEVNNAERFAARKPKLHTLIADRIHDLPQTYLANKPAHMSHELADPLVVFERGDRPDRPIPPMFLPVGTKDPLLDDTRRLARAVTKLGGRALARYYEGELHGFHALIFRKNARRCWRDTYAFLDEHLLAPVNTDAGHVDAHPT
jgi:acetyl esterase